MWLPFSATQWCDGKSFLWRASVLNADGVSWDQQTEFRLKRTA